MVLNEIWGTVWNRTVWCIDMLYGIVCVWYRYEIWYAVLLLLYVFYMVSNRYVVCMGYNMVCLIWYVLISCVLDVVWNQYALCVWYVQNVLWCDYLKCVYDMSYGMYLIYVWCVVWCMVLDVNISIYIVCRIWYEFYVAYYLICRAVLYVVLGDVCDMSDYVWVWCVIVCRIVYCIWCKISELKSKIIVKIQVGIVIIRSR